MRTKTAIKILAVLYIVSGLVFTCYYFDYFCKNEDNDVKKKNIKSTVIIEKNEKNNEFENLTLNEKINKATENMKKGVNSNNKEELSKIINKMK